MKICKGIMMMLDKLLWLESLMETFVRICGHGEPLVFQANRHQEKHWHEAVCYAW